MTAVPLTTGINLLHFKPVRVLLRWAGFPYVFQGVMLVVLVTLAVLSWKQFAPDGVADSLYAKTNLVQLLIWGLWWPAMVWAAVSLGRAWCSVCPLELVANVSERVSRQIGVPQQALGKLLRSGAVIVVLYAVIQMLVAGIHLHRVPAYTSFFLFGLIGASAMVGFLFKDRAFCRGFCPVGLLLGTYGRGGMLAVRHDSTEACDELHESRLCSGLSSHAVAGSKLPESPEPGETQQQPRLPDLRSMHQSLPARQYATVAPSSVPCHRCAGRIGLLAGRVVCHAGFGFRELRTLYGMAGGAGGLSVGA